MSIDDMAAHPTQTAARPSGIGAAARSKPITILYRHVLALSLPACASCHDRACRAGKAKAPLDVPMVVVVPHVDPAIRAAVPAEPPARCGERVRPTDNTADRHGRAAGPGHP